LQFAVHGASLHVHCADPVLAEDVRALLSQFRSVGPDASAAARLELRAVDARDRAGMPGPEAQLLCEGDGAGGVAWPWQLFQDRGRTVVVWSDRARLEVDPVGRHAVAWIVDPAGQAADGRASVIFFAATELLRRAGLFTVHAAAVERHGQALMLLAPSGGGKTTAMLSLRQAGWRVLSDDHPILRDAAGVIEILPFAVPARVTADTAARFTGLAAPPATPRGAKAEVAIGPVGQIARPSALLLTEIVDWPASRLELIARGRALEEVLRLALGLASADPDLAARHFRLIARLVRETPCYRLLSGRHIENELPGLVDSALMGVAA
jgi:hypothetical protein